MSGRPSVRKAPLPLTHHFFWTLLVSGFLMVAVLAVSYVAQANPGPGMHYLCSDRVSYLVEDCTDRVDTFRPDGATP